MRGAAVPFVALLVSCRAHPSVESEPSPGPAAAVVQCVPVASGPLPRSVELRGRVMTRPGGDLPLASLVAGKVLEMKVEEGSRVRPGGVIAIVDDLGPRAAAGEAKAALARARSTKAEADAALTRAKRLEAAGIMSKGDLDTAEARAAAADADVSAQEAAAGLASGTLGRVEVRSTFDGVVTKIWRGAGAVVDGTATTPIVEVAADAHLEFVADVTEPELALLQEGDAATVKLSSRELSGTVVALSRALDPKTGLGTVRVSLASPVDESLVRIGAFGTVRVEATKLDDALAIPRAAMRGAILDGADVAKCDAGKATIVRVTVGYRDETMVQVLSGLSKGDRVAVGDVLGLADGTPITESSSEPAAEKREPGASAAAPSSSSAPATSASARVAP